LTLRCAQCTAERISSRFKAEHLFLRIHDSPIVPPHPLPNLVLVRDGRGSLVHVRNRKTNECLGCIEVGLFELLKTLILAGAAP
jgi:hypothetical protein